MKKFGENLKKNLKKLLKNSEKLKKNQANEKSRSCQISNQGAKAVIGYTNL